ncbi:TonB-dependent receptor [Pontibacter sp. 13R65]|uniref:SusC/RagA family TonB-linked outer membrane protein n=1 Tax=Pontibacter sp. 13R65 TaxID=3127458 RepID=UPI00301C95DE
MKKNSYYELGVIPRGALLLLLMQVLLVFTARAANAVNPASGENLNPPAQTQLTITGRVTDAQNEGLPGVTVLLKGTTIATPTSIDGSYSLTVPDGNGTLVFSFVGYQTQEVSVSNRSTINVTLATDAKALDEVVVVGYGTQKEKDVTGSVTSVSAENFNKGPQQSPQQLIQGKMSGVQISQNSGKPGGSNTVRIRGGTSVTGSNEPLYVIDGVPIATAPSTRQNNVGDIFDQEPVNPLMTLNPNDIESVTVLKDASATAIYGSRGANGVIVITTKKGAQGRTQTSYSALVGISTVPNRLDMLTADEYRQATSDLGLTITDLGANMNWQDEIFRTAITHDHNLSLSGGSANTQYRASLGYGSQEGVVLGSDLDRLNARVNVNHNALDGKLGFDLRVTAGQINSQTAPISNTVGGESGTNMLYDAYVFNPTFPVYNEQGEFNHVSLFTVNPISYADEIDDQRIARRFLGNLSTTYQIVGPLSVNLNLGHTYQDNSRNSYIYKASPLGAGVNGLANTQSTKDWTNLLETTFNFQKDFGKHSINAIAGYSFQYFADEGIRARATGFISDAFKWNSLQAASNVLELSTYKESNKLISYYSRINYNFADRFLVTATVRRDGSSRFGSGNKWGIFPSASVAWRISEENFFPSSFISDLKLRGSYGVTGNQEIGNLNSITTLGASTQGYVVGGVRRTIVLPQQYANPNLQWEQTAQLNVGVDFQIMSGRIYGKVDYYRKETTDLLLRFAIPSPSVVSTQLANVGSVENKGFEFEIGSRVFDKGNFSWRTDLNLSANRNKILSLSNDTWSTDEIPFAPVQGSGLSGNNAQLITPGQPLGAFYGRTFLGVENGVEQFGPDRSIIGNAQPNFIFGFNNTFTYKNLDLMFNIRGSQGNDVLNLTALNLSYLNNLPGKNVLASAIDAGVARNQPKNYSSRWIENGSFVRLDNLTLGYNINVESIGFLSNARVFMTGQNLLLITGYSGLDPEVNSDVTGGGVAPLGIDYLGYPRARTISFGANVTF